MYCVYEFIERRRVWERVASRCDGETLFPEIFLPRQVGRKPPRKRSYYFPFHDAPRYACLHAEREKRRTENGGQRRQKTMGIMRMGNIRTLLGFARCSNFSGFSYDYPVRAIARGWRITSRDERKLDTRAAFLASSSLARRHHEQGITCTVVFSTRKLGVIGFRVAQY